MLYVSLRYLTFPIVKLRFRFDLGKLKATAVRFASLVMGPEKFYYNYIYYNKDSSYHGGI
jgi:hypothetical protein